jgi:hypothetical protein
MSARPEPVPVSGPASTGPGDQNGRRLSARDGARRGTGVRSGARGPSVG